MNKCNKNEIALVSVWTTDIFISYLGFIMWLLCFLITLSCLFCIYDQLSHYLIFICSVTHYSHSASRQAAVLHLRQHTALGAVTNTVQPIPHAVFLSSLDTASPQVSDERKVQRDWSDFKIWWLLPLSHKRQPSALKSNAISLLHSSDVICCVGFYVVLMIFFVNYHLKFFINQI